MLKTCKAGWDSVCCVACLQRNQQSGRTRAFLLASNLFMMFGLSSLFLSFKCPTSELLSAWSGFHLQRTLWTLFNIDGTVQWMSCLSFEQRQYTRCYTAGEDKNSILAIGSLYSEEARWWGRFFLLASLKYVPGNNVEIKITRVDHLAQVYLIETALKVKMKFLWDILKKT